MERDSFLCDGEGEGEGGHDRQRKLLKGKTATFVKKNI